jgi:hypothetical protein
MIQSLNQVVLNQVSLKTDQKLIVIYQVDFKPIRYSTVLIWIPLGT